MIVSSCLWPALAEGSWQGDITADWSATCSAANDHNYSFDITVTIPKSAIWGGGSDSFQCSGNIRVRQSMELCFISYYYGDPNVGPSSITGTFVPTDGGPSVWLSFGHTTVQPSCAQTSSPTKPCDRKSGGDQCSTCGSHAMARYTAHSMLASLDIEDTPIRYSPPRGSAIDFTVTYNQRDGQQPQTFSYSNLGPKWTFNWLSYVTDDPNNASANAVVYVAGGGAEAYSGFNSGTQSYLPDPQSHTILVRTSSNTYEKRFPDGSKQVFGPQSDGATSYPRKIFMTQWVDGANNPVSINYDNSFPTSPRISSITDALGTNNVTFSYELPGDTFKITKVTDPFGRYAVFGYTNGQLTKITDPAGIQSVFTYSTDVTNFITSLQTPYGTSNFATGQSGTNKWVEMTDPLGGKERVEYRDSAPGISGSDPVAPGGFTNSALDVANTFYWDKKAYPFYPDYTKARSIHWAKNSDGSISGIAASEKAPLENRVWYTYTGQSDTNYAGPSANPSQIARILDDGTTQLLQYQYNGIGKMTQSTDSVGRVTSYAYDTNNIDLLTVYQERPGGASTDPFNMAADKIASYTYNALHKPLTATDAAGKTTTYTYRPDGHGQLQSIQNARGETTTYSYGPVSGVPTDYLASITSPPFTGTSAVTSFTYDSANRVRTVINSPDNYTVTTDYDNLDRPTKITYPDGTNQQFLYTQDFQDGRGTQMLLDITQGVDRRGSTYTTTRHYNRNRQMDSITDPLSRTTLYGWCICGSLESITDPRGKITQFNRDLQSRVISKVFGYGATDSTSVSYTYENATSRLKSMTDAKSQVTNYQYFGDDNVSQVSYTDTSGHPLSPPTPTVSFTYDPNYNRIASMTDGTGVTSYSYYLVTSTPPNGAGQLYQVAGPLTNSTITYSYDELGRVTGRSINGVTSTTPYDSLGRPDTTDNVLGHFSRKYEFDVTPRLKTFTFPTAQTSSYTYFDNSHDRRLQTLQDLTSGSANVSKFDYTYDAEGQIKPTWMNQLNLSPATTSNLTYDLADQLTGVTNTTAGNPSTSFSYGYDPAGNRTSDSVTSYSINDVNEITNTGYSYDANGNMTSDGVRTYEWDAANRLTAINYPTISPASSPRTEFTYDGLSRRVKLVEKDENGAVQRTSNFVWDGMTMAEERDATGATVVKRFLPEGVQIPANASPNSKLYYSKDHLGSTRSLTNENGTVLSTVDYDAYGGISRAPVPANDSSGAGPTLVSAVSRLTHGSAGTFDVNLPLTGAPGIEMRSASGSAGNYTLVLTFDRLVLAATGGAKIASGVGAVSNMVSFVGNTATVQLSGVADRQTITVELDNVVGIQPGTISTQTTTPKVFVTMSLLIGDVNQNGAVTAEDINLIQAHVAAGAAVDSTTFKYDTNADGGISNADVSQTKAPEKQGAALFPDFAFTGHYYHARSGLYLAPYRAYHPTLGRWISRDPIGEHGGLNLYQYVGDNPVNRLDPLGLISYAPGTCVEISRCNGICKYKCYCPRGFTMGFTSAYTTQPCSFPPPTRTCYKLDPWEYGAIIVGGVVIGGAVVLSGGSGAALIPALVFGL